MPACCLESRLVRPTGLLSAKGPLASHRTEVDRTVSGTAVGGSCGDMPPPILEPTLNSGHILQACPFCKTYCVLKDIGGKKIKEATPSQRHCPGSPVVCLKPQLNFSPVAFFFLF